MEKINLNWQYIPSDKERERFAKAKKFIDIIIKLSILVYGFFIFSDAEWQIDRIDKSMVYIFAACYLFIVVLWFKFIKPKFVLHDYNFTINELGVTAEHIDIGKCTTFEWEKIKSWSEDPTLYLAEDQRKEFTPNNYSVPNELYLGVKTLFRNFSTLFVTPEIRPKVIEILRHKGIKELKKKENKPILSFKFEK